MNTMAPENSTGVHQNALTAQLVCSDDGQWRRVQVKEKGIRIGKRNGNRKPSLAYKKGQE